MTKAGLSLSKALAVVVAMAVCGAWSHTCAQADQSAELALKSAAPGRDDVTALSVEKLIDAGRLQEARAKLREQKAKEGERPRLLLFEAMILYRERQYHESLGKLEHLISLNDSDPDVYKLIGLNLVSGGREDLAGPYFEQAANLAPRDFTAWYYLGLHQVTSKEYQRALTSSRNAIQLNPAYVDGYLVLGVAQEHLGKEVEAIRTYRQAIEIVERQPLKTETPFLYLARLLVSLQQFEESLPLLKRAVAINPKSPESQTLRGQVLGRFKQYDQAIQSLLEAARLAPQDKSPHYALMGIYQKLGRAEDAQREMRIFRALEQKENN